MLCLLRVDALQEKKNASHRGEISCNGPKARKRANHTPSRKRVQRMRLARDSETAQKSDTYTYLVVVREVRAVVAP